MSQLHEQILNQPGAPFMGGMGPGIGMMNQPQYQPPTQQPIAQGQNIGLNQVVEDQKNTESNFSIYI
jgi:hypothetical protein